MARSLYLSSGVPPPARRPPGGHGAAVIGQPRELDLRPAARAVPAGTSGPAGGDVGPRPPAPIRA
ncbi:hypothetical protein MXD60_11905 [Frankia sp. AgB32]|nr:hypothetical protein [Frankia sp. AgB32]